MAEVEEAKNSNAEGAGAGAKEALLKTAEAKAAELTTDICISIDSHK